MVIQTIKGEQVVDFLGVCWRKASQQTRYRHYPSFRLGLRTITLQDRCINDTGGKKKLKIIVLACRILGSQSR